MCVCVKWRLVALAVMGLDLFFFLQKPGHLYTSVWAQMERVCVLRCAMVMCSSVKNVRAKQNHLQQSKKSWIEAFLSRFWCFYPAVICILLLFPCPCKASGNIFDISRSGMSCIFVWHKSMAFLKCVTINKVGFFQCYSAPLGAFQFL